MWFFKRNCLGLQRFLPTQSLLVLQPEAVGTYLPGTGTLGWGAWCGAGTPCSRDTPPELLSTTHGTSLTQICGPPTSLDGCGILHSVVVRLPFNSISVSSERRWFCILVVILLWLCKDAIQVCLCRHLDWKSYAIKCNILRLCLKEVGSADESLFSVNTFVIKSLHGSKQRGTLKGNSLVVSLTKPALSPEVTGV